MNFVLLCNSIYLLIVTTGTRPFPQPGNQLPPGDGFFLIFFFSISLFLSMFLVPWHFLPRTIFILDWLEQASCAYIYVPFLIILPCCTFILVDCLSSLEYPLISYGDFIVLFVIIVHVYMYKFWCMCLKASFVVFTSHGIPSLSMGLRWLMYYSYHLKCTCKPPFPNLLWNLTCSKLDIIHLMYWTWF